MKSSKPSLGVLPSSHSLSSTSSKCETPIKPKKSMGSLHQISPSLANIYVTPKCQASKLDTKRYNSQERKSSKTHIKTNTSKSANKPKENIKTNDDNLSGSSMGNSTENVPKIVEALEIKETPRPEMLILQELASDEVRKSPIKEDLIDASESVEMIPQENIEGEESTDTEVHNAEISQPLQQQEDIESDVDIVEDEEIIVESTSSYQVEKTLDKLSNEPKFWKEGYIMKKSSMFFGWEKQYFRVEALKIYYTQSKEFFDTKMHLKCLNLMANPCEIVEHKGQEFSIATGELGPVLSLKANSTEEADEWVSFFNKLFKFAHQKLGQSKKHIPCQEVFHKPEVVLEEEFLASVGTGDVLLLRSEHFSAKMQRLFTGSEYDHLALILREKDTVYLYDSNMDDGVQLTSWKDFKKEKHYLNYSGLSYRKLQHVDEKLRAVIHEKLWVFVTLHIGKKYELNIKKLFRKSSFSESEDNKPRASVDLNTTLGDICTTHEDYNVKNSRSLNTCKSTASMHFYRDTDEGFFCSELVAAAYKSAGLLDMNISCTRYLPVSFSQKKDLTLLQGSLSHECGVALIKEH